MASEHRGPEAQSRVVLSDECPRGGPAVMDRAEALLSD